MKSLSHFSLLLILILWFVTPAYSSWTEYKDIRYLDLDGDLADEIIIESKHGAGTNHYLEDMRIFKDKYPELELIFTVRILDSYFGLKAPNNYNIVSGVKFTEQTPKNKGIRDIVVTTEKVYFKDRDNKIVDKEEDLGAKVFKWNGKSYTVHGGIAEKPLYPSPKRVSADIKSYKVDLDNDGKKEIITTEGKIEKDINFMIESIITVTSADKKHKDSFSMPERLEKIEFISLNRDGRKQIIAQSHSGMHYSNLAIYGYRDGALYKIFGNGSACGIETDFKADRPLIKIGVPNFEKEGWSYADEPLWEIYAWNRKTFVAEKRLYPVIK